MKGLEISRKYYEAYGRQMLETQFPELLPYLAAGMTGMGSQCFGYDDEVSQDHDFEPGFVIFLPGEEVVDRRQAFLLERAYAKLPAEFEGCRRPMLGAAGGSRYGVIRTADFYEKKTGTKDGILTVGQWLTVPEQSLAEAVNGEIYFDNYGEVARIREAIAYYPEDIRRKKLAGHLLLAAQAGQYNYLRCIRHGETGAAQMAVFTFVKSAMQVIFLLNRRYQPYYKWSFRALRAMPKLSLEAELLEYLITTDNGEETGDGSLSPLGVSPQAEEKYQVIESIAGDLIEALMEEGITKATCGDLEKHAYSVNDGIADAEIRNMHVLAAV